MSERYDGLNFQRVGEHSNAKVGRSFEELVKSCFARFGLTLEYSVSVKLGFENKLKTHKFDLGTVDASVLVECKSHKWTSTDNIPSAKLTVWNEAMLYFHLAPRESRKIFCVLKDRSKKRGLTLGEYYVRTYDHMIPTGVEIWELDEDRAELNQIF